VLQVQQTVFKDTFSTSIGPNFAEVTGLRCNITPKSTNSKILIRFSLCLASQYFTFRGRILRDGTAIDDALGNQRGSNRRRVTFDYCQYYSGNSTVYDMIAGVVEYLDSPSTTSAVQYSIDLGGFSTSYAVYVNRTHNDLDATSYNGAPISTVTLTEIGG
jgi:hypothetical protein